MPNPHPNSEDRTFRSVMWTLRYGRWLWLAALVLAIPAAWRTAHLYANLRSDVEELLPRDAPSVKALDELRRRMPGLQFLGVLVDAGAAAPPERMKAAERFIDDLANRVRQYPPELVGGIRIGYAAERAFIEGHAPVLVELDDLRTIRERVEDRLHYEYGKTTGTLLDDTGPPPLDFSDIEKRYRARAPTSGLSGDRFSSAQQGVSLLLIEVGGFSTSAQTAARLINRVRGDIKALGGPQAYAPGLRMGYTGDVAVSAEETSALMSDLALSSVLVVAAVILALFLYFRWWPAIIALLLPLGVSTVFAFALGNLLGIRELNSNTAFLGSIIVGNGINFGIIQLARYVEARRRGCSVEEALRLGVWGTRVGTLSAALAAGVAYASLIAMQFRGFRQFGVIGGLGMILCWSATFVLGPPLIAWLDRGRVVPARNTWAGSRHRPIALLSRWVARHPRAIVLAAAALTVLALVRVRTFGAGQLEYDFSRMRRADTWRNGEGYWGKKMDALLGQYLTPTVLLTDTDAETRAIVAGLRRAMTVPPLSEMVASVRTVEDVLPGDQDQRRVEIERIRKKLTPNIRASLTPDQLTKVDQLLGHEAPKRIEMADIPQTLLKGLLEHDGRAGRAVLVYPKPTAGLWQGPRNAAFVEALRAVAQIPVTTIGGRAARVAGGPPLTADIIASMNRDGPLASIMAFVGVVLTVLLLFRVGIATPFVLGSLVVGVAWLLALAMTLHIKINFINFIAFPITFGIGVDYAVNVMARYLRDGTRDVAGAIRGTGGAVGLCSVTTILGYSSLLLAQNLGLFTFGLLAVLGELTCLSAAIVVLPAALLMVRGGPPQEVPAPPSILPPPEDRDTEPSGLRTIPDAFDRP